MKFYIHYTFKSSGWGGGNQFLKALRQEFINRDLYSDNIDTADVILFNSHHNLKTILDLKYKYQSKIFIHRVDGPLFLVRGGLRNLLLDKYIFYISQTIADATVLQSEWSRASCVRLGYVQKKNDAIIRNACDASIFNSHQRIPFSRDRKIRLIAISWSSNKKKGFDVYDYLDKNLNFNTFDFVFVGNSPIRFKRIKQLNALSSQELSHELKMSDIFITASEKDPCSNALIEAMSCGLPVLAKKDGGHPELVGGGGLVFNNQEEIFSKLNILVERYEQFQQNIPVYSISRVVDQYLDLAKKISGQDRRARLGGVFYFFLRTGQKMLKMIRFDTH